MKFIILIFLTFFQIDLPSGLNDKYSENQIIVIFSPSNQDAQYENFLLNLAKDPLGLDKRDLLIFEIFTKGGIQPDNSPLSEEEVDSFRTLFNLDSESFMVVLLNKKKDEIFRTEKILTAQELFKQFDAGN